MARYVPPSIETVGLEAFLDAKKAKAKHNDLGYREFKILAAIDSDGRRRVNIANLGRAFNVSRITIEKWISHLP